jgi:hypothetical protein
MCRAMVSWTVAAEMSFVATGVSIVIPTVYKKISGQ